MIGTCSLTTNSAMTRAVHFFAASFLILLALAAPPVPAAARYTIAPLGIGGSGYRIIRMNDNGQFLDYNGLYSPEVGTTPVGFQATNLNNLGQVVGISPVFDGTVQPYRARLWTNGSITDLGPGGAYGINDQGDVVGVVPGEPYGSSFIWTPTGG